MNGKVVLITGAVAVSAAKWQSGLHANGAELVLTDVDETALREIGTELGEDRVLTAVADVRDLAAMQDGRHPSTGGPIRRHRRRDGQCRDLHLRFGSQVSTPRRSVTLIDVNVIGVFNTVRAACRR